MRRKSAGPGPLEKGRRAHTFTTAAQDWLRRALRASHLSIAKMDGATSSSVYRIEAETKNGRSLAVLRVIDNAAWLAEEPDLAVHEAAALAQARGAVCRTPECIAYAQDDIGFGGPAVLMTHLPGRVEIRPPALEPWLANMAHALAAIHRHPAGTLPWSYSTWTQRGRLAVPDWTSHPDLWARAIEIVRSGEPADPPVFLHRDFHPTNILWDDGEIVGVVDWVNSCQGPAAVDVAHCRVNLTLMYGYEAAERFLDAYTQAVGGFTYHPFWDLDALLDTCWPAPSYYKPWRIFGLPPISDGELIRRVEAHISGTMAKCSLHAGDAGSKSYNQREAGT